MKRPTLNFGACWCRLSALALLAALQAQSQPQPVQSPQILPLPAQVVSQAGDGSSTARTRPGLSPWAKEIVKLTQAGVAPGVVDAFIDNAGVFALGADQIIYLTDLGVPQEIIQRMLQHDRDLVSGALPPTIVSEPPYEPLVFTMPGDRPKPLQPATAAAASTTIQPAASAPALTGTENESVALRSAPIAPTSVEKTALESQTAVAHQSAAPPPAPPPRKSESLYRVREPQPVELLPPILFLNAYEPQPNMLVIVGFPRG